MLLSDARVKPDVQVPHALVYLRCNGGAAAEPEYIPCLTACFASGVKHSPVGLRWWVWVCIVV